MKFIGTVLWQISDLMDCITYLERKFNVPIRVEDVIKKRYFGYVTYEGNKSHLGFFSEEEFNALRHGYGKKLLIQFKPCSVVLELAEDKDDKLVDTLVMQLMTDIQEDPTRLTPNERSALNKIVRLAFKGYFAEFPKYMEN